MVIRMHNNSERPDATPEFQLRLREQNIPDEKLLADVRRVAMKHGNGRLSFLLYQDFGSYAAHTVMNRFGSWNKALTAAGLPINNEQLIDDQRLFENIERLWRTLGRQPGKRDLGNGISEFSEGPYRRRFGSWNQSLVEFVKYVNDVEVAEYTDPAMTDIENRRVPGRDINLRLRFRIMQRDRFRCCQCGRSPATDLGVVLHVDHIIPWSKGGETTMENLQTLCSDCNLGKSDLV
jgi:hypothetical protein